MTTINPPSALQDSQLSAIYQSADQASAGGQRATKRLVRTELVSLVVASIAGVSTFRMGPAQLDLFAAVSAVAFLVAMSCTTKRAVTKPEEDWYEGRAAAESARTLGWKYSVGANPFPLSDKEAAVSSLFLTRLQEIIEQLKDIDLSPPDSAAREITDPMKHLRAADLSIRRQVYQRDRVQNQLDWYARRSREHTRSARLWLRVAIAASALGVVAALLKFFIIDVDLLGIFAAVASSSIAWNQLNQHRNQATAYAITARELSIIRDRIDGVPDDDWAKFVSDSEDAISREHTMWLARHGRTAPRPP